MSKEVLCIILLVVFFAIMIYVGFYSRKHATDVNGFVLGGRGVGPWLTALSAEASDMSGWLLMGLPDSLDGTLVLPVHGRGLEMHLSGHCLHGMCLEEEHVL